MGIGGSIQAISIKGRTYAVAADADATLALGGFTNEVQSNGDGSARILKTRVPWSITGLQVDNDHDRADHEALQGIANAKEFVAIAIEMASGVVYQAEGIVNDTIEGSSASATIGISVSGPGSAAQQ